MTFDERDGSRTAVVIVTYGRRQSLLQETVARVLRNRDVGSVIVVDNGCELPVSGISFGPSEIVKVLRCEENTGSAGGFARGLSAAMQLKDSQFVLILDDDNFIAPHAVEELIATHRLLGGTWDIAINALRLDRVIYRRLLTLGSEALPLENSFLGFHFREIPRRIWNRIFKPGSSQEAVRIRQIRAGPYGGLFCTMEAIRHTPPPRTDFILYGDDHEYTTRLTESGVKLYLTDLVQIEDGEQSWNIAISSVSHWISPQTKSWQIFYSARNHVYLEYRGSENTISYALNGLIYFSKLLIEATFRNRSPFKAWNILRPFRRGVGDGMRGRLGLDIEFPIPGSSPHAEANGR